MHVYAITLNLTDHLSINVQNDAATILTRIHCGSPVSGFVSFATFPASFNTDETNFTFVLQVRPTCIAALNHGHTFVCFKASFDSNSFKAVEYDGTKSMIKSNLLGKLLITFFADFTKIVLSSRDTRDRGLFIGYYHFPSCNPFDSYTTCLQKKWKVQITESPVSQTELHDNQSK